MSSTKNNQPIVIITTINYDVKRKVELLMSKVTRQIRIEPKIEDAIQEVADRESRSFSSTCNWLLGLVAKKIFGFS